MGPSDAADDQAWSEIEVSDEDAIAHSGDHDRQSEAACPERRIEAARHQRSPSAHAHTRTITPARATGASSSRCRTVRQRAQRGEASVADTPPYKAGRARSSRARRRGHGAYCRVVALRDRSIWVRRFCKSADTSPWASINSSAVASSPSRSTTRVRSRAFSARTGSVFGPGLLDRIAASAPWSRRSRHAEINDEYNPLRRTGHRDLKRRPRRQSGAPPIDSATEQRRPALRPACDHGSTSRKGST